MAQFAQPAAHQEGGEPEAGRAAPVALPPDEFRLLSSPTPSGAEPPYPPNHTVDGAVTDLGSVENAGFEEEGTGVGSPIPNFDLETSPVVVASVTNGDFETGNFTGWTTNGAPTIQSDQTHGYWARLTGSDKVTSEAVTIPQSAQGLAYQAYFPYNGWMQVWALSGPDYATSTKIKDEYCSSCGWVNRYVNLAAYRGESIKIRFQPYIGQTFGINDVRVEQVFPGYEVSGDFERLVEGSDHYAKLSGSLTSDAFTIDPAAQFATVELKAFYANSQYSIDLALGPNFTTWSAVSSGFAPGSWQAVSFNVTAYAGQQVKVRVRATYNRIYVDDVFGSQMTTIPDWTIAGTATRLVDGVNHYVQTNGVLTSSETELPADVQNVSFRLRSVSPSGASVVIELLRGTGFSQTVQLDHLLVPSTWTTLRYGVDPYGGETVKLRVWAWTQGNTFEIDDAGLFEKVLPGWESTSTYALEVGENANGTYVTTAPDDVMFLLSGWFTPGGLGSSFYSVTYDFSYGGGTLWVDFVNDSGGGGRVYQVATSQAQGLSTAYFLINDFLGSRGRLAIKLAGGHLYSVGTNAARQHQSEPFARQVGTGIDTVTGAVGLFEQDLAVPGPLPLSFTRYYNSHADAPGPLGFGWSHAYETHLVFEEVWGDPHVGVVFGSGREEFFKLQGSTYQPADPRVHSTLVENQNGTFTLTTKDNLDYQFTSQGRLTAIEDLNGNALDLAYDGQSRLSSVTGQGGVALTFAYGAGDQLASVTDPAGSLYQFSYDGSGDLTSVTDPEDGVRFYTYDRHRLASVTDENGQLVVANAFDEVNRLTSQTDANGESIELDYATPARGVTQVTYPDGETGTFYFDLHHRTTDTVDPSDRVTSFLYDANGNLDEIIDSGNNEWDYVFDASADLTSVEDPLGNPVNFDYNAKHLPVSVTDARGNETSFTYDSDGNMTSKTDPLGNTTTFTYDSAGNLLTVTDALNRTTTFTYNAKGYRTSATDPLGNIWTYTYTWLGRLETETDPLGNTTTYSYDFLGRLTGVEDPLGRDTTFIYDPVGHLLRVEDPAGGQTTWDYDERGLVEAKIDPAGKTTTYTWDENRRMSTMTNPAEETTSYGYDEAGRLISVTDALGHDTTYTYDAEGRLASKTDPLDRVTSYVYDEAGRLVDLALPNGATNSFGYDADRNLTSVADALERTTTYAYDELSRLVSMTDPLSNQTARAYDDAGQLVAVTDPLGNQTTYAYDDAGRLESATDPLGNETSYGYDDAGRRVAVTDATERTTSFAYDDAGQLVAVTDPGGNTTENDYDLAGRLASVTSPAGHVTSFAYDPRGLLTTTMDPLENATAYAYDDAGRLVTQTDPMGSVTSFGYDDAGRPTTITDDLGGIVTLGYDAASQLTSVTDPNDQTWTYGYNALGLRTSITDPLDRVTSFGYDAAGQLTSRTDGRGVSTSYGYDDAGRLGTVTFPGGSVAYAYDDAGRRTQMVDGTGTSTWTYDDAGQVLSVASPEGTIGYTYDDAGRRASMTLPGSKTVSYGYDAAGRLGSLTDWRDETTTFGYDADSNRASIERPNGVDSTFTYDVAGRVTDIAHANGAQELLGFAYAYDDAGRPVSVTTAQGTESYAYDDLGRLTSISYPDGLTVGYTYDAAGNRLSETRSGSPTSYSYDDAGQLVSVGGTQYTYDDAGNLTQAGSDSFSWDHASRLLSASVDSHSATYAYDGDGIRVGATVDGASSALLVDREAGLPTVVGDGATSYVHAEGLLESVTGSQAGYGLSDRLGSVRGLADDSGDLVGSAAYEAFGAPRITTGVQSRFGFAGEPTDATGLIDLRARTLDPVTGRMLSADSVMPNAPGTQGFSLYAYVANNPTTWTDPTGHFVQSPADAAQTLLDFYKAVPAAALLELELLAAGGALEMAGTGIGAMALAIVGIIVIAVVIWYLLDIRPNEGLFEQFGSESAEGVFSQAIQDLLDAPEEFPAPPEVSDPTPPTPAPTVSAPNPPIPWDDPSRPPGPGWKWRGNGPPGSDQGSWFNPATGEKLHPHSNPSRHGYHWDYDDGQGSCWRIYPDGRAEQKPC
jgi:RHS repeat-associated protein